ncbi:MAG: YidC/Oxa1 family membrane protein insertase [Clostridiales bacterium]|nr:YidC/Oxa1 family membrane protein insertase [Clostridiales bacterium]
MSLGGILYQLIISPITLLLQAVYTLSYRILGNFGAAIFPLSLSVSLLLLPFYNRSDALQEEERKKQDEMAADLEHFKATFKGDKRYMILQTYYRQKKYRPIYALRSSLSLLLQIPFFIAAYRFLSGLSVLHGASLWFLKDLGEPDRLISIGTITINVLPILMTVINIISGSIYTRGRKLKDKIPLYAITLIFLILLYRSPSALVLYWTLNNVFSLIKNIIVSLPRFKNRHAHEEKTGHEKEEIRSVEEEGSGAVSSLSSSDGKLFFGVAAFLTLLLGVLIPSAVISSSTSEFVLVTSVHSPVRYIFLSFLTAAGVFLLWCGLFYYLMGTRGRNIFTTVLCAWAFSGVMNYLVYGKNTNSLNTELIFDVAQDLSFHNRVMSLLLTLVIVGAVILLIRRKPQIVRFVVLALVATVAFMSGLNIHRINADMPQIRRVISENDKGKPTLSFSRDGKNVVVFMLDRAISSYVPYIFQENPELAAKFDGFTWYPNTLSYGIRTLAAAPALFGGYEYTPVNTVLHSDKSSKESHDEALLTMPLVFDSAGYDVTVCDPPYAGYSMIPDLSIFDPYPSIDAYSTEWGMFREPGEFNENIISLWNRNFFCYSLMKVCPLVAQPYIYTDGTYFYPGNSFAHADQTNNPSRYAVSFGLMDLYLNSYEALRALPGITTADNTGNTFFMMQNCASHNVIPLQEPDYVPVFEVDNTDYDLAHADRFTYDGVTIDVDSSYRMAFYHGNMAALIQMGNWLDKLRELGVYDNTRIIIVADHGWPLEQFDGLLFGEGDPDTLYNSEDAMGYNPLLLYKDFNEHGQVTTDYTFMTNADTPYLAMNGLLDDPRSPFTGRPLFQPEQKEAEKIYVMYSDNWSPDSATDIIFTSRNWYSLSNQNIFDKSNWKKEEEP